MSFSTVNKWLPQGTCLGRQGHCNQSRIYLIDAQGNLCTTAFHCRRNNASIMLTVLALLLTLITLFSTSLYGAATDFPQPKSLTPAVKLWKSVYSKINSNQGFIHDNERMYVVYETITLKAKTRQGQNREIEKKLARYRTTLKRLGRRQSNRSTRLERKILKAWGRRTPRMALWRAADRVRFQRGQADRFRRSLERSGAYLSHIRQVLKDKKLPLELAALPHVESSFNPKVYSYKGAAGLWQFMPYTGKLFMRVDDIVDERLDVRKATVGAAGLLKQNYALAQSWPLAVTGYNHGMSGMQQAVRKLGTKDIGRIVKRYKSPSFGFASRNFYASFLAASQISSDPEKYFGKIKFSKPDNRPRVKTPAYFPTDKLAKRLGVNKKTLQKLNPALLGPVWDDTKFIPKGYMLKLPGNKNTSVWRRTLSQLAKKIGRKGQKRELFHKVKKGESLAKIAKQYRVSLRLLLMRNNLHSRSRVRAGKKLRLPRTAWLRGRTTKTKKN